mgnify:CR=1 FL=1
MDKRFNSVMAKLLKIVCLATVQNVKKTLKIGVQGASVQGIVWKDLMEYQPGKNGAETVNPIA